MALSEAQFQELWDKQALHDNLMTYVRAADRMDIEGIRGTYWPDSTDDHGGFIGGGHEWAEEVNKDYMRDRIYSCSHHMGNVLSEINGSQAKRESMFLVVMVCVDPAITHFLGGRYRDLCEKRDDEWKILTRTCIWDWCHTQDSVIDFDYTQIPFMSHWGARFPDDPIYKDWSGSPPTPRPDRGRLKALAEPQLQ